MEIRTASSMATLVGSIRAINGMSGASGARRSNYPISRPINLRTPATPIHHRDLGILNPRPPQLTIYTR